MIELELKVRTDLNTSSDTLESLFDTAKAQLLCDAEAKRQMLTADDIGRPVEFSVVGRVA
jgi:hypothetical protein